MKTVNEPFDDIVGKDIVGAIAVLRNVWLERNQLYLSLLKVMLETENHSITIDMQIDGEALFNSYSLEFVPDSLAKHRGLVNLVHHVIDPKKEDDV